MRFTEGLTVSSHLVANRPVYTLSPANISSPRFTLLYFHGGAYYNQFAPSHWRLMGTLCRKLNAQVVTPDYPLTPEYCYRDVFRMLQPLYRELANTDRPIAVMGDSAGGGLALAISQYAMEAGLPLPARIDLLSPWLDLTMTDPRIEALDAVDPFLEPDSGRQICRWYSGGDDPRQYRTSPLYGPLKGLPPISIYTGTRDILNADAHALRARLARENQPCTFHEETGMIHTWMLFPCAEGNRTVAQLVKSFPKFHKDKHFY